MEEETETFGVAIRLGQLRGGIVVHPVNAQQGMVTERGKVIHPKPAMTVVEVIADAHLSERNLAFS